MPTYDFEGGTIPSIIRNSSLNPWVIDTTNPSTGTYCMTSDTGLLDNEYSECVIVYNVTSAGTMSFDHAISSEASSDKFFFAIDGVLQTGFPTSGTAGYATFTSASLAVGWHTFYFCYAKDASASSGNDRAYVDNIVLPTGADLTETFEGFESGFPAGYTNGTNAWAVNTAHKLFGTNSLKSTTGLAHGAVSDFTWTGTCDTGDIIFAARVSSEYNFDFFKFYIDAVEQTAARRSGIYSARKDYNTCGFAVFIFPVTAGARTFKWEYSKDGSGSSGDDAAYVDFVYIPESGGGGGGTIPVILNHLRNQGIS